MTFLPTKYVPIEHSILGVAALMLERLAPSDTIVTLWERLRADERVRTFERFADALTLLYAGGIVILDRGVIRRCGQGISSP